ncbi:MAG: tetratricopeptide repeat protein [Xanthobacteraceae bacterium]
MAAIGLLGLAFAFSPAVSFDGTRTPEGASVALPLPGSAGVSLEPSLGSASPLAAVPGSSVAPLVLPAPSGALPSPQDAFRAGTHALRQGRTDQAILELEYAAEQGVPGAIWKLGRMYADGDGVKMSKPRAYEYFRRLTRSHTDDNSANSRFVANAFVALGLFHLDGIPGTLRADPNVAREMFREAAAFYRDPEAQYYLALLYLEGRGAPHDAITAARWLALSANNGEHRAQALLGTMLFKGDQVARQAARGLFWLTVAKESAAPNEPWIAEMHASAISSANDSEKALAHKYLTDWLKSRRE